MVVRFVCWNGVRDRPRRRGVGRFFFFKPFRGFTGQGLEIQIEGPEKVSLGQETTYFINYRNRTSEPIASAQFLCEFSVGFYRRKDRTDANRRRTELEVGRHACRGKGNDNS